MSKKSKKNRNGTEKTTSPEPEKEKKWEDLDDDLDADDGDEDPDADDEDEDPSDEDVDEDPDADDEDEDENEDPDSEVEIDPQYYTVANGDYMVDGVTVKAGQKIQVSCKHCAMWKQPLAAKGGKVLCSPGVKTSFQLGEDIVEWEMREDRFSCQQYFVPKDIPAVVDFLKDDVDALAVLRYAFPIAVAIAKTQTKFSQYCSKHRIDGERADALLTAVNDFAYLFSTEQQVSYVRPLVSFLAKKLKVKHQRTATPRRAVFSAGDDVTWTDGKSGVQVSGFIRTIGGPKKKVSLIVVDDDAIALRPELETKRKENPKARIAFTVQYDVDHWLTMKPEVVTEALVYQED